MSHTSNASAPEETFMAALHPENTEKAMSEGVTLATPLEETTDNNVSFINMAAFSFLLSYTASLGL